MNWLQRYAYQIESTDVFRHHPDHLFLLAGGLVGEAGSILAEIKKIEREKDAYPEYCQRMSEELGDFLWYYVRLVSTIDRDMLGMLSGLKRPRSAQPVGIHSSLQLPSALGLLLNAIQADSSHQIAQALPAIFAELENIAHTSHVALRSAAKANIAKTTSRWPKKKVFRSLFDQKDPTEEQLPREFAITFIERKRGSRVDVLLRSHGIGVGDRVTDNIADPDGYRYHDIFHMAYAVYLGWSPVVRSLLRCKRKSKPSVDKNEDGARAQIIEEGVTAIVFSRAKKMRFFEGARQIDYDLLKTIQSFVNGYEVDQVPVWQWELAILEGFRLFHLLRKGKGGTITWNITKRTMTYTPTVLQKRRKPNVH